MALKPQNFRDFPGGPMVKNPPSKAGDVGLILGWELGLGHNYWAMCRS